MKKMKNKTNENFAGKSFVKRMRILHTMNDTKYTVVIAYSFNGVPETLNSGIMSKDECEGFIEEAINEKEWVKVNKKLSTESEFKKFVNVHNISSMKVAKLIKYNETNYAVVKE